MCVYCLDELRRGIPDNGICGHEPKRALDLINRYGGIDGEHHKQWVIDQVVRILAGDDYADWVAQHKAGDDGLNTYDWNEGVPP